MIKQFSNALLLLLLFWAGSLPLQAQNKPSESPNIIYILADDLGYGDLSCYNENSKLQTPNIDKLSKVGMLFTDAHTSSAVCTPTRYSILTGRYNWRSKLKKGVLSGYSKALIEPQRLTVGGLLQESGYHTAFVGKWHLGWDWAFTGEADDKDNLNSRPSVDFSRAVINGPKEKGFSYSYGFSGSLDMPPYVYVENGFSTSIPENMTVNVDGKGFWRNGLTGSDFQHVNVLPHLTDKAVQYIDEQAGGDSPFFLYFALPAPHTPILPTTEFLGKSNTNFYGDFVLQVDDVVGQIVEALEKNGITGETMVIFTSDNGCSPMANFSELEKIGHNPSYIFRGHKADIYEGGHRVPFIVSWPNKINSSSHSDEILCTTDFMATAAELVGYQLPANAAEDSYSFLSVLTGTELQAPLREATIHHSIDGRFAIRQGDWKLILWPGSGGWTQPRTPEELSGLPPMQLYNLKLDPSESENVIVAHSGRAQEMKTLLSQYVINGRSTAGPTQQNDGAERWDELEWMED